MILLVVRRPDPHTAADGSKSASIHVTAAVLASHRCSTTALGTPQRDGCPLQAFANCCRVPAATRPAPRTPSIRTSVTPRSPPPCVGEERRRAAATRSREARPLSGPPSPQGGLVAGRAAPGSGKVSAGGVRHGVRGGRAAGGTG